MMTAGPHRAPSYVPRVAIEAELLEAAGGGSGSLQILEAPRGAGKSCLLSRIDSCLAARGVITVLVDLERLCTTPAELAAGLTAAVDRASGAAVDLESHPRSSLWRASVGEEAGRRRPDAARLVDLAFGYPAVVAEETARPLVLLLDEAGEIAHLSRRSGLRDCLAIVSARLAGGPHGVVAAVSPASRPAPLLELLQRDAGERMRHLKLPPFDDREISVLLRLRGCEARPDVAGETGSTAAGLSLWMNATGGHPLYAEILARRVRAGGSLASALATEMTPPLGALHQECRFDYHLLVERSRGHASVRAILQLLSREEGATLSRVAGHLKVALPTALDYLAWLLEVALIRRDGPGYVIADPLMALWVRLNGPGPADPMEEIAAFLARSRPPARPPARPRGRRPGTRTPIPVRTGVHLPDLMIEID